MAHPKSSRQSRSIKHNGIVGTTCTDMLCVRIINCIELFLLQDVYTFLVSPGLQHPNIAKRSGFGSAHQDQFAVHVRWNSPSCCFSVDRIEVHSQSMKSIEELPFKEICWSDELQFETNSDTGLPKSGSMHIRRKSGRANHGYDSEQSDLEARRHQAVMKAQNRKTTI